MNNDFYVNYKGILVLFELLNRINQKDIQYLKQLYSQSSDHFEECIDFLLSIKLISMNSGYIEPGPSLNKFLLGRYNDNQTKEFLINVLLNKRDKYLLEYLEKFSASKDKYIFETMTSENLRFSNIRNLLIELEFIFYDNVQNKYELNEKYIPLFLDVIKEHSISPDKLKKIMEAQDRIGKLAELKVLEYEKTRLSSRKDLVTKIEHISLKDTSAGYDIKSFTILDNLEMIDRYIEVKAISNNEIRFFLSQNEMKISAIYNEKYYL
ncbi:MAG: DUF3883 domain-containing protein, partial [Ignavibacteriales bacterium]